MTVNSGGDRVSPRALNYAGFGKEWTLSPAVTGKWSSFNKGKA